MSGSTTVVLAHGGTLGWDEMLFVVALPMAVIIGLMLYISGRGPAAPDDDDEDDQEPIDVDDASPMR